MLSPFRQSARRIARSPNIRSYSSGVDSFAGPSFELTEEQNSIQDLTRQFTVSFFNLVPYRVELIRNTIVKANEIIPVAAEHDLTMKVKKLLSQFP